MSASQPKTTSHQISIVLSLVHQEVPMNSLLLEAHLTCNRILRRMREQTRAGLKDRCLIKGHQRIIGVRSVLLERSPLASTHYSVPCVDQDAMPVSLAVFGAMNVPRAHLHTLGDPTAAGTVLKTIRLCWYSWRSTGRFGIDSLLMSLSQELFFWCFSLRIPQTFIQ